MKYKAQNIHRYVQDPRNKPKKDWIGLHILGVMLGSGFLIVNLIAFGLGATEYNVSKWKVSSYPQETYQENQERRVEHCRGDFTRIEIIVPGFYLGCTSGPFFEWLGDSVTKEL